MPLQIKSIRKNMGPIEPVATATQDNSPMIACQNRWAHHRESLAGKPWHECPPDLVADFARSTAKTFLLEYAEHAAEKAVQITACTRLLVARRLSASTPSPLKIMASWPSASSWAALEFALEPDQAPTSSEPPVSVEVDAVGDATEDQIALEMAQMMEHPKAPDRLVLDPLEMLPDEATAALVFSVEKSLPGAEDLELLIAAAAALLVWRNMEIANATTVQMTFSGLTHMGQALCPGQRAVMSASAALLDRSAQPVSLDAHAVSGMTRRPRP